MAGGYISNDEIRLFNEVTLTTNYADNTTTGYEHRSGNGLSFLVNYVANAGSATAYALFVVEISYDNTTWVPYSEWTLPTAGTRLCENETFKVSQTSATGSLTIDELRGRYFRVRVKEASVTGAFYGTFTLYVYPHAL